MLLAVPTIGIGAGAAGAGGLEMDKIGIIAWGSLYWDPRDLKVRTGGLLSPTWRKDGPRLDLEFSRVSGDGRLTLVIDETNGSECATLVAQSSLTDLNKAIENLMTREGTSNDRAIGYINFRDRRERDPSGGNLPRALCSIRAWGENNRYDALIWTGLRSNFEQKKNVPFSIESALIHLKGLTPAERRVALDYFQNAPPQIVTPLRTAVAKRF